MTNTSIFTFRNDEFNMFLPTTREQKIQAYYAEHANAAAELRQLKWIVAAALLVVGAAAWAGESNIRDATNQISAAPAAELSRPDTGNRTTENTVTKFIDGPTGFVFVYTAEGWKFVPGSTVAN